MVPSPRPRHCSSLARQESAPSRLSLALLRPGMPAASGYRPTARSTSISRSKWIVGCGLRIVKSPASGGAEGSA